MPRWLILAALTPVVLAVYLLLAVIVGRWLRIAASKATGALCDCEECDPPAKRLRRDGP